MNNLDRYMAIRPTLNTFDLLQYAGTNAASYEIMRAMKTNRSHSGVVFRMRSYDTERLWTIESIGEGLVLRSLSSVLANYHGECYVHRMNGWCKVFNMTAAAWLLERVDKVEYDWTGCISHWRKLFGMNPRMAREDRLWCTEAVFLALRDGARVPSMQGLDYAPVPGEPMLNLGLWDFEGTELI